MDAKCPCCGEELEADDTLAGQEVKCPTCAHEFSLETPQPTPQRPTQFNGNTHNDKPKPDPKVSLPDTGSRRSSKAILIIGYACLGIGLVVYFVSLNDQMALAAAQAGCSVKEFWDVCLAIDAELPRSTAASALVGVAFLMGLTGTIMQRYIAGPILIVLAILIFAFMNAL